MRLELVCITAIICFAGGCSTFRKNAGGSAETGENVLTAGPVVGNKIRNLPPPVRATLTDQLPQTEITEIAPTSEDGRLLYRITFAEPGGNSVIYVRDDGAIVQPRPNKFKPQAGNAGTRGNQNTAASSQ